MIVVIDHSERMKRAYEAGVAAAMMHYFFKGPKPDADEWLDRENKITPTTVRG